ncbi:Rrf2 family transcriptional regulator [Nonomuraea jabiensis]|uniref:Rrf2 family transcriptional regulator n=1 Tax=Nonomuraea jabiensis TaxID=882448 RepID=UPI00342C8321
MTAARLARPPERITLLDVVTAIEGPGEAFRCEEVLRKGPGGRPDVDYRKACVMRRCRWRGARRFRARGDGHAGRRQPRRRPRRGVAAIEQTLGRVGACCSMTRSRSSPGRAPGWGGPWRDC